MYCIHSLQVKHNPLKNEESSELFTLLCQKSQNYNISTLIL